MSKKVYLIRHASAEDGSHSPMFKDINRELTSKGMMESAKMGAFLKEQEVKFDKLVYSSATRTSRTAEVLSEQVSVQKDNVIEDEGLYGGGPRAYLRILNEIAQDEQSIAIVGHNPDISFFAEYLTRDDVGGSFEKCTVVCLEMEESTSWAELSAKSMHFKWRKAIIDLNESKV